MKHPESWLEVEHLKFSLLNMDPGISAYEKASQWDHTLVLLDDMKEWPQQSSTCERNYRKTQIVDTLTDMMDVEDKMCPFKMTVLYWWYHNLSVLG